MATDTTDTTERAAVYAFLDAYRAGGTVNSYALPTYVVWEFGYSRAVARQVVADWMASFKKAVAQ